MSELPGAPVLAKASAGPTCQATGCTATAIAQWQRRLTADEYAGELALIQARWDAAYLLRDQQKPDPIQPPMPSTADFTRVVLACGTHAISLAGAAHTHQSTCSGPDSPALPHCDCTPEPLPTQAPKAAAPASQVPAHWLADMAGSD